ncbi:hypothetical protein DPMN_149171 [Dreissena polymorpha]|uniref:Uncharacterized protein n=1 Tax=Dreissena polymorpha TaxID=45954 RepID=A0A9D4FD40_DREPO|nr:hypothetical protein DPMN_149171 [Dreissena polymorpha]
MAGVECLDNSGYFYGDSHGHVGTTAAPPQTGMKRQSEDGYGGYDYDGDGYSGKKPRQEGYEESGSWEQQQVLIIRSLPLTFLAGVTGKNNSC